MSAGAVKAGGVFVEIGADPRRFFATLNRVNKAMANMGRSLAGAGAKLGGMGVASLAPFAAAVRAGTAYQSTLLNIQASTGATAAELDKLKAASMQMSAAMGKGPTEIAGSFLELLKAGMSVEQVLGGAGKAAIEFAAVGQMDVAQAAVVMADAMNVFGVDASRAANSISSAADASSTSIELMAQSFAQVSAVAALANQSIDTTSAALAVLANAGVKGSDAGTSLKTMLMRLMAPANDAVGALSQVGLSVQSFRNADGTMKPLVEIIGVLNGALGNLDQAAKDDIFRRIFGQDAIRAAAILTGAGVDGFNQMTQAMGGALSVGEKYKTLMSGLAGAGSQVIAAMERFGIAVSDAVAPALMATIKPIVGFINGLADLATNNKEAVAAFAKFGVATVAVGGALTSLGISLQVASFGMGGIGKAAAIAIAPLRLLSVSAMGIGGAFTSAVPGVAALASAAGSAMVSAGNAVARFAAQSATQLASFASTGIRSVLSFGSALQSVFASQFRIARFVGQSFSGAIVTAFSKTAMSVGVVRDAVSSMGKAASVAVTAIGPSIAFVARGFAALGADVARLAGPITAPFFRGASAIGSFASAVAGSVASYVTSVASAVAATVTANVKIAAAWVGSGLKAVYSFAAGVAGGVAAYVGSLATAVGASVASAAGIAGAWLSTAFPATAAFVAGAVSGFATYIASTVAAAAASVTNAVKSGVAWVASGLPGVTTFVAGAIGGLATYLGAAAAAVAGSVASAAAVAAAWLAPLAPFAAVAAAVAGVGALLYSLRDQISSAFAGVTGLVGQAADAIGGGLNAAVSDGMVVFSDLATTATTTFNGIYEAIAAGDLSGAMDVLWAGLYAGWLRGVEALMGAVDPWISMFQNAFTILGAEIYKAWDSTWTMVGNALNMAGAFLLGAMDNIINPLLAAWDTLEAGIRKSWNRVQSLFKSGFNLKAENDKVDSEMAARKRQRELDRPGIEGRTDKAAKENADANKQLEDRRKAVDQNTQATVDEREAANRARADERRAATQAAEANLGNKTKGKRETRARNSDFTELLKEIEAASSLDQLRDLYTQFDALSSNGRLTSGQSATLEAALEDAQERVSKAGSSMGGKSAQKQVEEGAAGAGLGGPSQAQVVGTFSSVGLGGLGFGSSLAQKQLDVMKKIEENTREGAEVAA